MITLAGRSVRIGLTIAGWVLLVALVVYLWPVRFGGSTEVIVVRGDSMEPLFTHGDLVVTRRTSSFAPGDIVTFEVPSGPAQGMRIMHRIVALDPDSGRVVTKGDNRLTDDMFDLHVDDLTGSARLRVPWGGTLLWVLSRWWVLGVASGLLTLVLAWPRSPERDDPAPAT